MSADPERVVLVTGAASGIGAAIVRRIAQPGTALVLHARRKREALEAVATEAAAAGAATETVLADLVEPGIGLGLVDAAVARFGRLDQIVSNAGFADRRPFGEVDAATLRKSLAVIAEAFFDIVTAALPLLRASTWGRVVVISSFVPHVQGAGGNLFPATAAAKAALEALARVLAYQLAPAGVTVNCVAPGYTRKDATGHSALTDEIWRRAEQSIPVGRLGMPADTAGMVAFLLGREAAFITGQTLHVDGGMTL